MGTPVFFHESDFASANFALIRSCLPGKRALSAGQKESAHEGRHGLGLGRGDTGGVVQSSWGLGGLKGRGEEGGESIHLS